jgi:periplasmic protein CpxP/Spy
MRLRIVLLAAALTAVAVPGGAGDWPGGGMHKGKFWRRDKVRDRLELTDDEIDKLENVVARNRDSLEDLETGVKRERATLDTLLRDDGTSEAAVLAQVDRVEQARARLGKARVTMLLEMRNILTPEQRRRLATLHDKHQHKGERNAGD